jgi:hypothetical protein
VSPDTDDHEPRFYRRAMRTTQEPDTTVMGVSEFERFFREVGHFDIDKNDLKRYSRFVQDKIYDLLVIAEATAKASGRDIIERRDLPITKGLQESIHAFRRVDGPYVRVGPIVARLATRPQLDLDVSDDVEAFLPEIVGGLSVALARSFRIVDPTLANPSTNHWERAFRLFDLLL